MNVKHRFFVYRFYDPTFKVGADDGYVGTLCQEHYVQGLKDGLQEFGVEPHWKVETVDPGAFDECWQCVAESQEGGE